MKKKHWRFFIGVHLLALGLIEGLNPYWPIWLARIMEPGTFAYSLALAAVYGLPLLGAACSATYWGRFTDRCSTKINGTKINGAKINWVRSLIGLASILALLAWVQNIVAILALRFCQGLFGSVLPASQHLALNLDFKHGLFRLQSATAVAGIAGPLAIGWLLQWWSFSQCLFYAGLAILLASLAALRISLGKTTPEQRESPREPSASDISFFTPDRLFLLLQTARWLVVPALASLTLSFTEDVSWLLACVYSALPLGLLLAKPFWQRQQDEKQRAIMQRCLALSCLLTLLQLCSTQIAHLIFLRFALGFTLAPLMPWSQLQYLSFHREKPRGGLLGFVQRQQRIGMAAGLVIGSCLHAFPVPALLLSAGCYALSSILFFQINRNEPGLNPYV